MELEGSIFTHKLKADYILLIVSRPGSRAPKLLYTMQDAGVHLDVKCVIVMSVLPFFRPNFLFGDSSMQM